MSDANLGDGANGLSEADREILRQAMAVDWCPPCAQGTTDVDGCHCSALFEAGVEKVAAIVREHTERAWDEGYKSGHSNAMRRMSDEPNAPTTPNPYRKEQS